MKYIFNADTRRSSATKIGGSAKNFGGIADLRKIFKSAIIRVSRKAGSRLICIDYAGQSAGICVL